MQIRLRKKEIDMQVNTINNSNFGARFMDNPTTQHALAKLKETCISRGLSPQLYERELAKIHKIFPSNDVIVSLSNKSGLFTNQYCIGIKQGNNFDLNYIFLQRKNEKYKSYITSIHG